MSSPLSPFIIETPATMPPSGASVLNVFHMVASLIWPGVLRR
jgi:hypothetical protein